MKEPIPKRAKHFYTFGPFRLYVAERELFRGAAPVTLPPKALDTLLELVSHRGHVVDKDELMKALWPDTFVADSSLAYQISQLRKTLGDGPDGKPYIETIARRGYRFVGDVTESWDEEPADLGLNVVERHQQAGPFGRRFRLVWLGAGFALVLVSMAAGFFLRAVWPSPEASEPAPLRRFVIAAAGVVDAVIAPNGQHIAFVTGDGSLWIRDLFQEQARQIEGIDQASSPFWSPDSQFLAFAEGTELKRVSVQGGSLITLCRLPGSLYRGGAWCPESESILFSCGVPYRFYEVSALGGTPRLFRGREQIETDRGEFQPHYLPLTRAARAIVFSFGTSASRQIVVENVESGERKTVAEGSHPVYSISGHLVFQTGPLISGLWAMPFSIDNLSRTGEPFPVTEAGRRPSVANDGTLVYVDYTGVGQQRLVWRDRAGRRLGAIGQAQEIIGYPALSPDGRRVAVEGSESGNTDIWVHEVDLPIKRRLTFDPAREWRPAWSPSGEEITFVSDREGEDDLFSRRADGSGEAVLLVGTGPAEIAPDWSPDGNYLIYQMADPKTIRDLWYLKRKENKSRFEPVPFLRTTTREQAAKFSPDGRFVVYCSDESGRYEVYVRPFPEGGGRWQVSVGGGTQPRWSRGGGELFYVEGHTLMAVAVTTEPRFSAGPPKRLFRDSNLTHGAAAPRYDVAADRQRFVLVEPVDNGESKPSSIHVVLNWSASLRDHLRD